MTLTQRVLDGLGPTFAQRAGDLLPNLVDALVAEAQPADNLVQPSTADGARGWAAAFDARTTPDPVWLANATGTRFPDGLTPDAQRAYLAGQAQARTGTVPGMASAVRAVLVGTSRRVEIIERVDGDPYRFGIRVYAAEVPTGGPDVLVAAALTQKPTGLLTDVTVEVIDHGATYEHLTETHGTYAALAARFPTTGVSEDHVPEQGTVA